VAARAAAMGAEVDAGQSADGATEAHQDLAARGRGQADHELRADLAAERSQLARRRRIANVIWKKGELEKLPMRDGAVDVAMLSQALHHAQNPARAVAEAVRVTAPGGRVLVLDLRRHQEEWVRAKLGDRVKWYKDVDEVR